MKCKILYIFLILTIGISTVSYAKNAVGGDKKVIFPSYETVLDMFFNMYNVENYLYEYEIKFEKHKEGWFVSFKELDGLELNANKMLVWNASFAKYIKLDLPGVKDKNLNQDLLKDYLSDTWRIHLFEFCPYFGYVGWEQDVIRDFTDFDNMSDSLMYGVARAYSDCATNMIAPKGYPVENDYNFHLELSEYKISDDQLLEFLGYNQTAIELYIRIAKRNPGFKTIVGTCNIKAANEFVLMHLFVSAFRNVETAESLSMDVEYDDYLIACAKNYLNSCAPNSILMCYGDNDFFPILYLQYKLKYRTDVLVLCFPYLASNWYIDYLMERNINGGKLKLSLDKTIYQDSRKDVLYYNGEAESPYFSVDSLLMSFSQEQVPIFTETGYPYYTYDTKNLYFTADPEKIIESGLVNVGNLDKIETKLEFNLPKTYLLRNDLLLLDLLRTNNWERAFYSTAVTDDHSLGLINYFENSGFSYKFVPIKSTDKMFVNADYLYDYLMNKLEWFDIDQVKEYSLEGVEKNMQIVKFREKFANLAVLLLNEGDTARAKEIMLKCETLLPFDKFQPSIYEIEYAQALLLTQDYNESVRYLFNVANPFMDDINKYYEMSGKERERAKYKSIILKDLEYLDYINKWASLLGLEMFSSFYTPFYDECYKEFELDK